MRKRKDYIAELVSTMPAQRIKKAKKAAEKEIFKIRLAQLREEMGLRQQDLKDFNQSGISKLEARTDMKLSTLIEYLKNINMGMEIIAYPKNIKKKNIQEITILKV
ncbi:MAG TPA: XRE family transcriptional regulator [bacterium]|nr:XRE family transcriptional regulator [bacterium]